MSKPRVYTLELTAEDLECIAERGVLRGIPALRDTAFKVHDLTQQARADRERDDLRLPWRLERVDSPVAPYARMVFGAGAGAERVALYVSERVIKLMSAAPELLEAVQAADSWGAEQTAGTAWWARWCKQVRPLIERALRKVETGVPE